MLEQSKLAAKHLDRAGTSLGLGFVLYVAVAMYLAKQGRDGSVALVLLVPFQLAVAWHIRRAASIMGSNWLSLALALVSLLPPGSLVAIVHLHRRLARFSAQARRSLSQPV